VSEFYRGKLDFSGHGWLVKDTDTREGAPIESWTYTGADTPPPGRAQTRINLWLFRGAPPSDGREVEVVVARFGFTP